MFLSKLAQARFDTDGRVVHRSNSGRVIEVRLQVSDSLTFFVVSSYLHDSSKGKGEYESALEELGSVIAKRKRSDILVISSGVNADVGSLRTAGSDYEGTLGNHELRRRNARGVLLSNWCLAQPGGLTLACTFVRKPSNQLGTWWDTFHQSTPHSLDHLLVHTSDVSLTQDCGRASPIVLSDRHPVFMVIRLNFSDRMFRPVRAVAQPPRRDFSSFLGCEEGPEEKRKMFIR